MVTQLSLSGTLIVVGIMVVLLALLILAVLVVRSGKLTMAAFMRREHDAKALTERAKADLDQVRTSLDLRDTQLAAREDQLNIRADHLAQREQRLAGATEMLEADRARVEAREEQLQSVRDGIARERDQVAGERERLAGMTSEQARAAIVAAAEHDARLDAVVRAREIERSAVKDAEATARRVIVTAIQRLASEQTSESVISTVDLPNDDMKGRIIGREGRNIRHFEQVTGVNVMVDDSPGTVLLSCFDPVRRETARVALSELVADGRIHPARIEEAYERASSRIQERCVRAAEDALADVGITAIDPDLVPIIGSLTYRTSYGQNVLKHLVESAHIAGLMAGELGLDVATCKRAAFLHDIGKALTHEREGSHAKVGADLARRHGEHPDIVHAIEAHHNEVEPATVEAVLVQAADAVSGSRPGARRESLEAYVHRLDRLEEIAREHPGVEKVFAMQAGRELRVMVSPEMVDDPSSHTMARRIARQIEEELTYPGQIRVTVVRESRATELAH